MKRTKFAQMLEAERKRLGHSQIKTAEFLSMTQSAYSRMEKGKTNPGVERSLEIIKILESHGYTGIPPIEIEEIDGVASITFRWPWHRYWLYALIAFVLLLVIDFVINAPADMARGYSAGRKGEPDPDGPTGIIFLVLVGAAIAFGLYRLFKRWRR